MNNSRVLLTFGLCLSAVFHCCKPQSENTAQKFADAAPASDIAVPELPLPSVPEVLKSPEERAEFVALHFWDAMDFETDSRAADTAFMEQNFVNFISVLQVLPHEQAAEAAAILMDRAKADCTAFDLLNYVTDRYLDDPNSPMRDEELLILFLRHAEADSTLPDYHREVASIRLATALKNRKGTRAANFRLVDRNGRQTTLYNELERASQTLLMFYDPDCSLCRELKRKLAQKAMPEGLQILAVDTMGDFALWKSTVSDIPAEWLAGFATDDIAGEEIYELRALPTFFLLDADGTVILKDPSAPSLGLSD